MIFTLQNNNHATNGSSTQTGPIAYRILWPIELITLRYLRFERSRDVDCFTLTHSEVYVDWRELSLTKALQARDVTGKARGDQLPIDSHLEQLHTKLMIELLKQLSHEEMKSPIRSNAIVLKQEKLPADYLTSQHQIICEIPPVVDDATPLRFSRL